MSADVIRIAGRRIGPGEPPYIVAEMSANHGGSLERAKQIVALAAEAGADAIKFQAYTADSLTIDVDAPGFVIRGAELWEGRRLYELYREAAMPYSWLAPLFEEARHCGITPFCSPFDADAVAQLQRLDAPAYKIASFELLDHELIRCCAATGKPLVISTGLASHDEIGEAVAVAHAAGGSEVALLKCTSVYPATPGELNLVTISDMERRFGVPVGFSDHTVGAAAATTAVALGAALIEKHFIDARTPPTADSAFSATPDELRALVEQCRVAYAARGSVVYGASGRESDSLGFRRSLYVVRDLKPGDRLDRTAVRSIRPGFGLAPKYLDAVLGRRVKSAVARGTPLSWALLDDAGR